MDTHTQALRLQNLEPLLGAVRRNCDIADALHAGDYTLCVYLLKMREYFRWERGYGFTAPLPQAEIGDWLKQREQFWETLADERFAPLPLDDAEHDPFDADRLNQILNPRGLIYSAGLGQNGRAHFFLAQLEQQQLHEGFTVLISGDEYARDLTAPPAMSLGKTIFVRREALRRMIWEKVEEWRWNSLDNAMGKAIRAYAFDTDTETALAEMTDDQLDTLRLHEIGELMAGDILGQGWEAMLASIPHSRTELSLRAIRDHFADSLSTLPALLESAQPTQIHFFMATLTNLRKSLAPELVLAYQDWHGTSSMKALNDYIPRAQQHWRQLTEKALRLHADGAAPEAIQRLIDSHPL
ncbi:MAG: Sfum_1244 family protein [Gammaproteobacteria bacterium]